jgi:hypothetical protein
MKNVGRGLGSLELEDRLLSEFGPTLRPRDLQRLLGVSKSTTYRLIHGEESAGLPPLMVTPHYQRIQIPTRHFVRWLAMVVLLSRVTGMLVEVRSNGRSRYLGTQEQVGGGYVGTVVRRSLLMALHTNSANLE